MLSALLRFEMSYHFRQVSTRITALLFLLMGIVAVRGNYGGDEVHKNAPYAVTVVLGLLSMLCIFVSTLFCANVVLRDTTCKMDAILFTTSVNRVTYFITRFLGLLAAVFFMLCLAMIGIIIGSMLFSADRLGPFNPVYFLQPLFVIGLPNILFASSLLFSTALLTRNIRAVYVTGVLLYILYFLGSILGNSPLMASAAFKTSEPGLLPFLLDPFGLAAFFGETRSWSVFQRNNHVFPLKNAFLLNRVLWTVFSILLLAVSYRYFSFRLVPAKSVKKKQQKEEPQTMTYNRVAVTPHGYKYHWMSFRSQLRLEVAAVIKHIPFLVMIVLWIFLMAVELKENIFNGPYGTRFYAATSLIVRELLPVRPAMLLVVFYGAELVWRERTANMQALLYSTPVSNVIFWGSKCVTLGVLVGILISANIIIGISMQLVTGHFPVELPAYLSLYYYSGFPLFLFGVLVIFIQTLTPNKYLGMLLNLLIAGVLIFSRQLGIEHYLLRYATVPMLDYSGMNGFGHYTRAFNWYMLYWGALAAVLAVLAIGMWQGSGYGNWLQRVKTAGKQWGRNGKIVLMISLLLWVSAGAYIYYQTNIVGSYKSARAQLGWQLKYEQTYKPKSGLPQPVITGVKTTVDLYPGGNRYTVKGSYRLKNESGKPITTVWVGIDPDVTAVTLSLPGVAQQTVDADFNQHWFQLATPLLPGAESSLEFSMEVIRSGFMPFNNEHSVVKNGTYIELEKYVPFFGYNDKYEIADAVSRKEKGLPGQATAGIPDSSYHLIDFETTISTTTDQYAVTVGTLQKSWTAGNRKYFNYKTTAPIDFMFALSSASYAVKKEMYKGVELNICYQLGHEYNVDAILRGVKDALDYCSNNFSPYPLPQLTLAEIPQYRGAATAYPGLVFSAERINFMSDFRDSNKVNYAYATTVHEVAHQWWANKLTPLSVPGNDFLKESLAKYTEAMVIEKSFGKMYLRQYLQADNRLYFGMRNSGEQELPLAKAAGQAFTYYQKGGLTLYAIKEVLGEASVNQALHRLIEQHASPGSKAASDDFIRELYQGASASQIAFIDDCLKKVIVYKLNIKVSACKPLANGKFSLDLKINITKTDQSASTNIELLPGDDIDIALFDQLPGEWNPASKPFYIQKHRFSKNETLLTLTVDRKPGAVAIDPYGYILDEDQLDNIQEVK